MATNRLRLDFSLTYRDERSAFLDIYLREPQFQQKPPTEDELEMMGNYLLWGKDRQTGLNAKQDGTVQLVSKHGDWDTDSKLESLDALMEQPTFNEAQIMDLSKPPIRVKREVFSRDDALKKCPESLLPTFRELFRTIDETELKINYYELLHNKRQNPPRDPLLRKFTEEEQREFQETVTHWNQYKYLKKRHELVELRRQQYTLRDAYVPVIQSSGLSPIEPDPIEADWDAGIEVLPLGIWGKNEAARLLFQDFDVLIPQNFTEAQLKVIYDIYWKKKAYVKNNTDQYFDFRELEHIYNLFAMYYEMQMTPEEEAELFDSNRGGLMRALQFYIKMADLTDAQKDILDMKLKKMKNVDIAAEINKKYKKSYTANYISTIFRQRIIVKINEAASYHETIVENLCFPEEWKTCTCCGRTLLRDSVNFTKKTRSKDGFTTRCKKCEKAARTKGGKNGEEE